MVYVVAAVIVAAIVYLVFFRPRTPCPPEE